MTVRARIRALRIADKISRYPEYAKRAGIEIIIKKRGNYSALPIARDVPSLAVSGQKHFTS